MEKMGWSSRKPVCKLITNISNNLELILQKCAIYGSFLVFIEHIVDRYSIKWYKVVHGGMAEWFKAAVLKTVVRKYRGFESYFLRQKNRIRLNGEVTERPMVLAC